MGSFKKVLNKGITGMNFKIYFLFLVVNLIIIDGKIFLIKTPEDKGTDYMTSKSQIKTYMEDQLNSSTNPCGNGIHPASCTCKDGKSYKPGSVRANQIPYLTCGAEGYIQHCVCSNGKKLIIALAPSKEEFKRILRNIKKTNPGGNDYCTRNCCDRHCG